MPETKESRLTIDQLQQLQRNPEAISAKIMDVLNTLTDDDEEVRAWAADCLQEIEVVDPSQAIEVAELCSHSNQVVVNWACKTLAKAVNVSDFQDQLASVLEQHADAGVQQSAAAVLGQVKELNQHARVALEKAVASKEAGVRRIASQTLKAHS